MVVFCKTMQNILAEVGIHATPNRIQISVILLVLSVQDSKYSFISIGGYSQPIDHTPYSNFTELW